MAFSSVLRRSASSLAPLAARALRSQWNFHSAVFTALNQTSIVSSEPRLTPFLPPPRSYSTKTPRSDGENLLGLLDSEIQRAEEIPMVGEAPGGFPFKIEDKLGFETVTLSREYQGEVIKVEVCVPEVVPEVDDEEINEASVHLVVTLAKGNGMFISLSCFANPNEIELDYLVLDPENPEDQTLRRRIHDDGLSFDELDENLREALHKYLEIRGIKPSMTKFLTEYMVNKERREYLVWLKNLKKFVEA